MNARVKPVGAMKDIGWPQRTAYSYDDRADKVRIRWFVTQLPTPSHMYLTMPLHPQLTKNSTIPIEPSVIWDAIVPKLTAGERHAK